MRNPNYRPGDYFCVCDRCGFRYFRSQLRRTWDNLLVCRRDFELRHPQDLIEVKNEKITVDEARPEGTNVFLEVGDVTADDL